MRNNTDRGMRVDLSEHARIQIIYTEEAGQRMLGNGAFVRRNRCWGWKILWQKMGGCGSFVPRSRSQGCGVMDRLPKGSGVADGR